MLLNWKKSADFPRAALQQQMDKIFSKVKVTRIQKQYNLYDSVNQLHSLPPNQKMVTSINYEIEVEGEMHQKTTLQFYELLFDEQGVLLHQRVIKKNLTDNLIF